MTPLEIKNDLKPRMPMLALIDCLLSSLHSKQASFSANGLEGEEHQLVMLFALLRLIIDKTFKNEDCTKTTVMQFIHSFCRDVFNNPITMEQAEKLTSLFLINTLCNNGSPFHLRPGIDDWSEGVRYVDRKTKDGNSVYTIGNDGFHLYMLTLEVEDNMKISMMTLRFCEELKSAHYDRASKTLEDLRLQLQQMRRHLKEQKSHIIENIRPFTVDSIEEEIQRTINQINSSGQTLDEQTIVVLNRINDLTRTVRRETDLKLDQTNMRNLSWLETIQKVLGKLAVEISRTSAEFSDFLRVYHEQLFEQAASFYSLRSYKKLFLDSFTKHPHQLETIADVLSFVFFDPNLQINEEQMFAFHPRIEHEDDIPAGLINENISDTYNERLAEQKKNLSIINPALKDLLLKLIEQDGEPVTLKDGFLDRFGTLTQVKQFLSIFRRREFIDLDQLKEDADLYPFHENIPSYYGLIRKTFTEFDPAGIYTKLRFNKLSDTIVFHPYEDDDYGLSCLNLEFYLERREARE